MKCFCLVAKDATESDRVYEATRKFVSKSVGAKLSDRRVYRIQGVHNARNSKPKCSDSLTAVMGCQPVF
jgi:hypothetical protein